MVGIKHKMKYTCNGLNDDITTVNLNFHFTTE